MEWGWGIRLNGEQLQLDFGLPPTPSELRRHAMSTVTGRIALGGMHSATCPQLRVRISRARRSSDSDVIRAVSCGYSSMHKGKLIDTLFLINWYLEEMKG